MGGSGHGDHPRRGVAMSGHQGSIILRLVNPVVRVVCQSAWRRYHDDLDAMRTFLDRVGAASGLLAPPAAGCRIVDGELGGLATREFHPKHAQQGRAVLYLHGGGFMVYARSAYTGFLSRLANDLRARVIVPAYRLAPEHPFPAAIDDCLRAYEALLDAGQEPGQLIIAGESAGANATLVTLQRARDASLPMPAGAIMLSGGFDFSWTSPSETGKPRAEARFEIMVTYDAINYYADRARMYLAEKKFRPHGPLTAPKKLTSVYRPYPVVGVITPWNFPLLIPGVDAVPALLAGAAVLYRRQQAITTPRVPRMQNQLLWNPYSPRRSRTVAALLRPLVARDLRRRLFHGAHNSRNGASP